MHGVGLIGWSQVAIGLTICICGFLMLVFCVDGQSPAVRKWLVRGLSIWGAWFAMVPFTDHGPDSLAAQAIALLVASVLVLHGRRIRGILDGESWWEAGRHRNYSVAHFHSSGAIDWRKKLNPLWALLASDDGALTAPSEWSPAPLRMITVRMRQSCLFGAVLRVPAVVSVGLEQSTRWPWWRAICWWSSHLGHNLTHYVLGVADRDRLVEGEFAPRERAPNYGWLTCMTTVQIGKRFLSLPFVSYYGPSIDFQALWHPSGAFTLRIHRMHHG